MAEWVRSTLALILTTTLVLSGCLGGGKDKEDDSSGTRLTEVTTPDIDDTTCRILGFILDDENNPVPGATVGILATDPPITTLSDPEGEFALGPLEPGQKQIAATKAGYDPDAKSVTCSGGEEATQDLVLKKIPPPKVPHYVPLQPVPGSIGCTVGLVLAPADICDQFNIIPGEARMKTFPEADNVTGVVAELIWTNTSGLGGDCFRLVWPPGIIATEPRYNTDDGLKLQGGYITGHSPLNITIESFDPNDPLWLPGEGQALEFLVGAEGDVAGCPSKVVIQQGFELWVTYFYNGFPIPDGYTNRPG